MVAAVPVALLLAGYAARRSEIGPAGLALAALVVAAVASLAAARAHSRRALEAARADDERAAAERERRAAGSLLTRREELLVSELDSRRWLDDVFGAVYRRFQKDYSEKLKVLLDSILAELGPLGPISSLTFRKFELGARPPQLPALRAVRLASPDAIELEVEISHMAAQVDIELAARLGGGLVGVDIPVTLRDVSFEGVLRVRVELCDRVPHVDSVTISFVERPKTLEFALSVAHIDVGAVDIVSIVRKQIELAVDALVAPNCIVVAVDELLNADALPPAVADGVLRVRCERGRDLPVADFVSQASDPYLVLILQSAAKGGEAVLQSERTSTQYRTLAPSWCEDFNFRCLDPNASRLAVQCFDEDRLGADDPLGTFELPAELLEALARDAAPRRGLWFQLAPPAPKAGAAADPLADPPPRVLLTLAYAGCEPRKRAFQPLAAAAGDGEAEAPDAADGEALDHDEVLDRAAAKLAPLFAPRAVGDRRPSQRRATTMERHTASGLDARTLRLLYERGGATLHEGVARKEGFGHLRSWHDRQLRLELALEMTPAGKPAVSATLSYYLPSAEAKRTPQASALGAEDSKEEAPDKDDDDDDAAPPRERGAVRLDGGTDALLGASRFLRPAAQYLELRTGGGKRPRVWRIRCRDALEAAKWHAAIAAALGALRVDAAVVHREARRAAGLGDDDDGDGAPSFAAALRAELPRCGLAGLPAFGALLVVEVVEARKLRAADDSGLSDPYAVLNVGSGRGRQEFRTQTRHQTLQPTWFEAVEFWAGAGGVGAAKCAAACGGLVEDAVLQIRIYDDDFGADNELIASLDVAVAPLAEAAIMRGRAATTVPAAKWYALDTGEIRLRLTLRLVDLKERASLKKHMHAAVKGLQAARHFQEAKKPQ
ncbi:hypothetical protein M885DRAFT_624755 [Pelagophyceae sp. CCMP2097]|nr:hypothetical protein M885DRAFT_624755 [Pelagophyceae sp. CCMP2097]